MFLNLYRLWSRLSARCFTVLARGGFAELGPRSVLMPPIRVGGEERVAIGSGVFLGSDSWLQIVDGGQPTDTVVIRIGNNVSFSGHCSITACRSVIIEDGVLIARYVHISDHGHEFSSPDVPIKDQGIRGCAPVKIKQGAWLGQGVVVCPGVTIGRNSVIGANSVVREDVPDFCVAAGVPARVIRRIEARESA